MIDDPFVQPVYSIYDIGSVPYQVRLLETLKAEHREKQRWLDALEEIILRYRKILAGRRDTDELFSELRGLLGKPSAPLPGQVAPPAQPGGQA